MHLSYFPVGLLLISLSVMFTSCHRSSGSTWEDTKTLGHYIQRGSKLLFKQNPDSKLINDVQEFTGPGEDDFIPLNSQELTPVVSRLSQEESQVVKDLPSASDHAIPPIESFKKPSQELSTIFKIVHFNTDEHIIKDQQSLLTLDKIAAYMKKHPNLYVFIAGHCDERASEAYNLALGTRRANYVRNSLVQKGIDPGHIFTISFGKELPLDLGHTQDSWAKNRRVEFKIYEKGSTFMK